jgi:hypothetical protein
MNQHNTNGHVSSTEAVQYLARYWPGKDSHRRQYCCRDLVGGLLRDGMAPPAVEELVEELCKLTGDDEVQKRVALVGDTAGRLKDPSAPVTGWTSLIKRLRDKGTEVVGRLKELLGLGLRIVAGYGYQDESGCLKYQVVRLEPKDFRQRRPRVVNPRTDHAEDWLWGIQGIPRLLYRLPELLQSDPSEMVFICEGEKDADNVRALGLVATCNPMGAGKWLPSYNGALRGRPAVVLPDNDPPGREHAEKIARILTGTAASVKVLMLPGLPEGGDVSDWLVTGSGTKVELLRLAEAAPLWVDNQDGQSGGPDEKQGAGSPTQPLATSPGPPWPDDLGEEAYYGLAGDVVKVLSPASEADPAALLVQLLVGFGNLIGRSAHCLVENDQHFTNEYVVLIGKTSKARKGTSWGRVHGLLRGADDTWAADRVQSGLSSGEGLIWGVRDPIHTRQPVKEKGRVVAYEDVESDPGVADKRLMVVEPEFAGVLRQPERKGNSLSVVLRQAWETGDLRCLTKNSPARATGAHISLIGHITAEELRRYLTTTEMANGFGNRHLWACVRRSKELPEGGRVEESALAALRERLADAAKAAGKCGEIRRDDQARAIWREVYGALSADRPGLTGALLARAEAHVLRLSLLYAVLNRSPVIRAPHLMAALAVWNYCEQSVRHVFGDALGDPVADDVLRILRAAPDGMTRTELYRAFNCNVASSRIGHALALLAEHRLALCERRETGGRPEERWRATTPGRKG